METQDPPRQKVWDQARMKKSGGVFWPESEHVCTQHSRGNDCECAQWRSTAPKKQASWWNGQKGQARLGVEIGPDGARVRTQRNHPVRRGLAQPALPLLARHVRLRGERPPQAACPRALQDGPQRPRDARPLGGVPAHKPWGVRHRPLHCVLWLPLASRAGAGRACQQHDRAFKGRARLRRRGS